MAPKALRQFWRFLKGKKTYTTALVSIVVGVGGTKNGFLTPQQGLELVLGGTGLATVRDGVNSAADGVKGKLGEALRSGAALGLSENTATRSESEAAFTTDEVPPVYQEAS